jgi:glycerophosphoryl diester phosphodiesterase
MTICVGHRGGAALGPENSLAAFRAGIAAGADAIECDVHRTIDGHLVLMHDADVSRTTEGSGHIGAMTLAQLRRLNCAVHFGDGAYEAQQIPTLEDLLALAQDRCAVQIEIKVPEGVPYAGIEEQVVAAVRTHEVVASAQVICFDVATLARMHTLEPRLTLGYLASRSSLPSDIRRDPVRIAERARDCGASFLSLERQFVTFGHLTAVRRQQLGLAIWTVNERAEMEQWARQDIFAMTSDRPDLLRQVLDAVEG